ncbi:MAG: ABC transporter substrate-binding protein [bacterium]|nr:ABC transporter substrate-binding protein [bacterium]
MKKKLISMLMILVVAAIYLTGCGNSDSEKTSNEETKKGKVYYLSFKPESDQVWQNIAKEYEKEKGIEVKVVTAANGTYEQTLKSEIAKTDAPTLFQINGPVGYQNWKDYCMDLKDTDLYSWLIDKNMAVKDGDGVYGIPYVVEGYGIIYNEEIMDKYFALSDKAVDISSTTEIKNFDMLKKVVEDMTAKKDKLNIEGVFASTSLLPGDDWRWQTHLANMPVYYEYKDKGIVDTDKLEFTYADNFKNTFDLYINNSCTKPEMLGSKSVNDSMAEFALGKVAMVQNGNWAWSQISGTKGNVVKEDKVKYLPIYTGVQGEETQGLCIGTENFFCINSKASKEDQQASIDFIQWLYNSDYGKNAVTNDLNFISPFSTFKDDEKPTDPLAKEVIKFMSDTSLNTVSWVYPSFPSQTFKDNFGADLLQYANNKMSWDELKTAVIKDWESEKAATK